MTPSEESLRDKFNKDVKKSSFENFNTKESLSDKIELMDVERGDRYHPMVDVIYIKEFIKTITNWVQEHIDKNEKINPKNMLHTIKCGAGEKLTK